MNILSSLLTLCASQPLLAAGKNRAVRVGTRFRSDDPSMTLTEFALVLVGVAAIGVIIWIATRWYAKRENRVINNPRALFRELSRAHGLGRADQDLLREIAEWHELADPVQLFIETDWFDSAEMQVALSCETAAPELRARLFGTEAQEKTASSPL